jgi:Iap family predicted aminopeptidase
VAGLFTNKIKMTNEQIREHLLKAGVKNLKEFGYPEVTTETILTDEVYKEFFKSMLVENLGNGKQVDEVINQLLSDVTVLPLTNR